MGRMSPGAVNRLNAILKPDVCGVRALSPMPQKTASTHNRGQEDPGKDSFAV